MNTEYPNEVVKIEQKPKKQFCIGSVFCFLTAIAITLFALWEIVSQWALYLFRVFAVRFLGPSYFAYLFNSDVIATALSVGSLVTALLFALLGLFLLFKVKSRFLGVIFFLVASVPAFAIFIKYTLYIVRLLLSFFDLFCYGVIEFRYILTTLANYLFVGTLDVITNTAMAVCLILIGIVVLILGSSKKYSKNRAMVAIVAAAFAALAILGAQGVELVAFVINSGVTVLGAASSYINGVPLLYLSTTVVSVVFNSIYFLVKFTVLGLLYILTVFFSVKWIIAPYKKVK